jgi:hypothetical protein
MGYINYKELNKIIIKNKYPLSFINEILNKFSKTRFFIKFDLRDIYYRIRIKRGDE